MDCSPPGSSVHVISHGGILEWVVNSLSRDLSNPGIELESPVLAGRFFTTEPLVLVVQSCPTLCDSMDCSLPGSSVHGILQARILEWDAVSFFKRYSQPRDKVTQSPQMGKKTFWVLQLWIRVSELVCNILKNFSA